MMQECTFETGDWRKKPYKSFTNDLKRFWDELFLNAVHALYCQDVHYGDFTHLPNKIGQSKHAKEEEIHC